MAINVTSFINGYTGGGQALISEETRRKLIALGIDPAIVTSEIQAKNLIEKVQRARDAKAKTVDNTSEQSYYPDNTDDSVIAQNEKAMLLAMVYNADINKILLGL